MSALVELTYRDLHDHFNVLLSSEIQTFTKHIPTFLEVAGFPDYENVLSNIYGYFLSDRENMLSRLFMTALLRSVNAPGEFQMDAWKVEREVTVRAGRIDLVIREDAEKPQKVILVENKIYHHAEGNDFAGYLEAYRSSSNVLGILLTLEPATKIPKDYRNITHFDWMAEVKKGLGEALTELSPQQLIILQDFIRHIDRYYRTRINMDSYKFLFNNAAKISELITLRDNAIEQLKDDVRKEVNGEWQYYRSSGSSVAFYRDSLVLYVTTDKLFHPEKPEFQIQLWVRGVEPVDTWKKLKNRPDPGSSIQVYTSESIREWAQIATKNYSVTYENLERMGETVRLILEKEWSDYAKVLLESLR